MRHRLVSTIPAAALAQGGTTSSMRGRGRVPRRHAVLLAVTLLVLLGIPTGTVIAREPAGLQPRGLVRIGSTLFFTGCSTGAGCELWRSDGTAGGTRMVKDIQRGLPQDSSNPHGLVAAGGRLFFFAWDQVHGEELWVSDGTAAGTRMVKEIRAGIGNLSINYGDDPVTLVAVGHRVYFPAKDGRNGAELWVSDGTPPGTHLVRELTPGGSTYPQLVTAVGDRAFFMSYVDDRAVLWVTDGTWQGTLRVRDFAFGTFRFRSEIAVLRDRLLFAANGRLWSSDGTGAGTRLLHQYPMLDDRRHPSNLAAVGDRVWFSAPSARGNEKLWVTDGTVDGTRLVADPPGERGPEASDFIGFRGAVLFSAPGPRWPSIWRTDGTRAGTTLVKGIDSRDFTAFWNLTRARDQAFFIEFGTRLNNRLWRTDGTTAGTWPVAWIRYPEFTDDFELTPMDGILYFVNRSPTLGTELWRSDGTREGTYAVKDLR